MVTSVIALPVDLHAIGAEGDAPRPITLEIIPPPGAGGALPARDGRVQRVRDVAQLAAALNAQSSLARVDRDHRSEPSAATFAGTTAAEGWASHYRVNARGGIDAELELNASLTQSLRAKEYRYLSPALLVARNDDVVGLSSVALVNNPNFPLPAPQINSERDMSPEDTVESLKAEKAALETKLAASDKTSADLRANAAAQAVDKAIEAGHLLPAEKDYHLSAIKGHIEGVEKGIESFNALMAAKGEAPTKRTTDLTRRIGPAGPPPSGAEAPAYPTPHGWHGPSEERLGLHAKIAAHAAQRGITYRDALVEFGAIHGA